MSDNAGGASICLMLDSRGGDVLFDLDFDGDITVQYGELVPGGLRTLRSV